MASKRHQRRHACERKVGYPTKAAARAKCFDGMEPYECEHCSCWHVGHVPKRIRQSRRAIRAARKS